MTLYAVYQKEDPNKTPVALVADPNLLNNLQYVKTADGREFYLEYFVVTSIKDFTKYLK